MDKKVVDFQSKRSVKEGVTPLENVLQDVLEQSDHLDTVIVLSRTSSGDFKVWASGEDNPEKWVFIMEVCKFRIVGGFFD